MTCTSSRRCVFLGFDASGYFLVSYHQSQNNGGAISLQWWECDCAHPLKLTSSCELFTGIHSQETIAETETLNLQYSQSACGSLAMVVGTQMGQEGDWVEGLIHLTITPTPLSLHKHRHHSNSPSASSLDKVVGVTLHIALMVHEPHPTPSATHLVYDPLAPDRYIFAVNTADGIVVLKFSSHISIPDTSSPLEQTTTACLQANQHPPSSQNPDLCWWEPTQIEGYVTLRTITPQPPPPPPQQQPQQSFPVHTCVHSQHRFDADQYLVSLLDCEQTIRHYDLSILHILPSSHSILATLTAFVSHRNLDDSHLVLHLSFALDIDSGDVCILRRQHYTPNCRGREMTLGEPERLVRALSVRLANELRRGLGPVVPVALSNQAVLAGESKTSLVNTVFPLAIVHRPFS